MKAISANRLPRLNSLFRPDSTIEFRDYVECCLLLKDRLKHLCIMKEYSFDRKEEDSESFDDNEQPIGAFQFGPCARLLECLDQFKSLERIQIYGRSISTMRVMAHTLGQCPSLQELTVVCSTDRNSTNDVSNRSHNLKRLVVEEYGVHSAQIIDQVVRNFPKLENLDIRLHCRHLKDISYAELLDYLPKLQRARVRNIPWGEQAMLDTIGLFWKVITQKHPLCVKFKDPSCST